VTGGRGTCGEEAELTDQGPFDRRLFRPRRPEDFDALYAGTPPWDIGRPQAAFLALAEAATIETTGLDSAQAWLATITRVEAAGRMA
jgi:hypothetical protein